MGIDAYKEALKPIMDGITARKDTSNEAIMALGAICSIMAYDESNEDIEEELMGAQKYLNRYLLTKDKDYLTLTEDELSHARKFLIEMKDKLHYLGESDLNKYENYMAWHDSLNQQLQKYKSN